MQRFVRFSRYWDKVANSGRFRHSVLLLLGKRGTTHANAAPSPFHAFLGFSDWLWERTGKTSDLTPESLLDALSDYLCGTCALPAQAVQQTLLADYVASGARGNPRALQGLLPKRAAPGTARALAQRQERHRAARQTVD